MMLHISKPKVERSGDTWKVSAQAAGDTLWFKCHGFELTPAPEAFLATFFIPALHTNAKIKMDAKVNAGWIETTKELLPIYHRWWNYPLEYPLIDIHNTVEKGHDYHRGHTSSVSSLCFTGGVDSFYSLLKEKHNVQNLLFINGFDIALSEVDRFNHFERSLYKISEITNCSPIIVHTNMRRHPVFKRVSWERTHGAALIACGLLLKKKIESLIIPSSYTYSNSIPWGSHWKTDPLWSSPEQLAVIHDDASQGRTHKLIEIAGESMVQRYLRVCWQNKTKTGNCSKCEKCLRTMVGLEASGFLSDFHYVFDVETSLSELLDKLDVAPQNLLFVWKDLAKLDITSETRKAIKRLIRRSKRTFLIGPIKKNSIKIKTISKKLQTFLTNLLFGTANKL